MVRLIYLYEKTLQSRKEDLVLWIIFVEDK